VLFLILDGGWLGLAARSLYVPRIGSMMLGQPRWDVAAIFYFAVAAGWPDGSWHTAALDGAILGFIA
jgi:uncharacterized membrane protein